MQVPAGPVLVTGANGHLGRRTLETLAAKGVPARAVVRSQRAAATLSKLSGGFDVRILDYGNADALTAAAEGCDCAIHYVGILKESKGSRYETAHEQTSRALARAAARASLRRVAYLSILGAAPDSRNACLASKGRAERILLEGPVPAVVLRVPMVLGEGDHASRALAARARAGSVWLVRGGASLEQPIDAEDVVAAVLAALADPDLDDDVVLDLAGPESLPHRDLLARCAALFGKPPPVVRSLPRGPVLALAGVLERVLPDPPVTRAMLEVLDHDDRVDPAEAAKRLGIQLTPLDETLRRTVVGSGAEGR